MAAIATGGLVAVDLTTETVNSDKFFDFIGGSLIPQMHCCRGLLFNTSCC